MTAQRAHVVEHEPDCDPKTREARCTAGGRGPCCECDPCPVHSGREPRRELRRNPALILVHGNPRPPADVERAWCKFHDRPSFRGSVRDVGRIPGTPDYTFALGRCLDVNLGRGWQTFTPMPWLVFAPDDRSLWIVAEKAMKLGNGVAGVDVHGITYAPMASSGKDPARYRHKFEEPLPSFSPVGNPNYCRAILLDGGGYRVDDWIYE